ncbi:MAG: tetratricopeptide repeat protein [Salinibacter sp.]
MAVRRFPLGVFAAGIFLLLAVVPSSLRAQSVELLYDKGGLFSGKKYVSIAHASKDGTVPPDTSAVRAADRVYFAYRPQGDWTFGEDDKKTLRQITPVQDTSTLSPETVTLVGGDKAQAAVVGVPKADVDWLTPVRFRHKVDTSRGLPLKEYYAPEYPPLREAYDRGRRLLDDGKPLQAVEALRPFYGDVTPAFSLVEKARAVLDTAATKALDRARSTFRPLRGDLISDPDAAGLARLDSFRVQLDSLQTTLAPYLKARPDAGANVQRRIDNLSSSADKLYSNARSTYREKKLRIFKRGKYENPKLRLYLEVLMQMLIDGKSALRGAKMTVDSLRPSLLTTPRFAEAQRRLQAQGWETEFRKIVGLVNENIRERQEVFGDKVMESPRLRRPAAPQPYYEIVAAMNAILVGNRTRFFEAWDRALEKVTNLTLLNDLQRWRIASQLPAEAIPDRALRLAEEARTLRRKGELGAAKARLTLAARLVDGYAPFYDELGQIKQARGDTAAARTDYARARELAPSYAPPEVRRLRLLLAQNQYKQALARSDSLLKKQAYWLFYMPKARALVGLERYNDAVPVLRGRCEPLNDKSYALYAVLAKVYAKMGTWKGVRWALQRAKGLSPRRSAFETLIAEVRAKAKTEGVSLKKAEGDSVRTDSVRTGGP